MDAPVETSTLDDLLDNLTADGGQIPRTRSIIVRREGKRPVILRMLTIPQGERNRFLGAQALIAVVPCGLKAHPDPSLLAAMFGLTPAETRLAAALASGISTAEAADALKISVQTARQQLKAVFQKTGTHRQSELVALVARL